MLLPGRCKGEEAVAVVPTALKETSADKDSEQRQRAAITDFAKTHGYEIEAEFYDAAVSGLVMVSARAAGHTAR